MKRALWVTILVCVIVFADLFLFGLYIPPLVWHARHGSYVTMRGIRYKLPLAYLEHGSLRDELYITATLNHFPRKLAHITISKESRMPESFIRGLGVELSWNRNLVVAGQQGRCAEYAPMRLARSSY